MEITQISPDFSTSPQIAVEDVATLKSLGYDTIVSARPDGEDADQPDFLRIAEAAAQVGIRAVHIPVVPGNATAADAAAMDAALAASNGRTLGFCKSGARARALFDATGRKAG